MPILSLHSDGTWVPQPPAAHGVVVDFRQVAGVHVAYDGTVWLVHRQRRLFRFGPNHVARDLSLIPEAVVLQIDPASGTVLTTAAAGVGVVPHGVHVDR